MASIILTGDLQDPNSSFSAGDKVRFIHQTTTGNTIKGAVSIEEMPENGDYVIELQYGNILVEYKDILSAAYVRIGVVTVNQDSTATSLPELLNAIVPPTDEQLLEFQAILADCVTAEAGAVTARNEAEAFAATLDLINDLSQAYIFDTVAEYKAFTTAFPIGKIIRLLDRGAEFTVIAGTSTATERKIIASTSVSQSIVLIENGLATILSLGSGTTINIGMGGVFTNLTDAVDYVIKTSSIEDSVTFNLLTGFIMSEQILIDGLNVSEITITSVDAEVVAVRSALTESIGPEFFGAHFPLFGVTNGGTLPTINCLFNMDASGTATNRDGIYASLGSTIIVLPGAGVKNAGNVGCLGYKGVTMTLAGAIFDSALDRGVWARDTCNVDFEGGSAKNTLWTGFQCHNSIGNAKNAILTGNLFYGLRSRTGSIVEATGADCSGNGSASVNVFENSHLNAPDLIGDNSGDATANAYGAIILGGCTANLSGATFTNIDGIGVRVASTGFANLTNVDASGSSGNNPGGTTDFVINGGGATALLSGSTGTVNIVANTVLREGLVVDAGKARFYEEGELIPLLEGSGTAGSHTYSLQTGNWVRNGNHISMSFAIAISSLDGSWTGDVLIKGLPDSIDQNLYWGGTVSYIQSIGLIPANNNGNWHFRPITTGTLRLEYIDDTGKSVAAPVSVAGSSFSLRGSITFMTEALQ